MHQCFVHVHAIFARFFVFFALFSVSICALCFFVWAASYDGLMPPLAACHCNNSYALAMLCVYLANELSLSPRIRKFRQRWRHCFQRTMSFLFWLVVAETWVEFGFDGNMTLFAASLCLLVAGNTAFLLHFYLPPPTAQNYSLRNGPHNRQLPDRISRITDCNFTVRMLYRNIYIDIYIF